MLHVKQRALNWKLIDMDSKSSSINCLHLSKYQTTPCASVTFLGIRLLNGYIIFNILSTSNTLVRHTA